MSQATAAPVSGGQTSEGLGDLRRERVRRGNLADEPIIRIGADYHSPNEVLVGTHIPRLFDKAVPVVRRADILSQAYLALGAHAQPRDEHWTRFFEHVSETFDNGGVITSGDRRTLMEAYYQRGAASLPEHLDEDARCLLDREGHLFSPSDLRAGLLVENDYPALADALVAMDSNIHMADLTERSRTFFHSLESRPLTSLAGTGRPIFGAPTPPPLWFKPHHRDMLLTILLRPLFCRALHELAVHQRHATLGFRPVEFAELRRRIDSISGIDFLDAIAREYQAGDYIARVPVETAVQGGTIGLVRPRTKLDFQQLVAQALAEIAGTDNVAQARALSTVFLPLILCRTAEDMRVYLERMGADIRQWSDDQDDQNEDDGAEDVSEEILRQVMEGLDITKRDPEETTDGSPAGVTSDSATQTPSQSPSPPAPPPFMLPDLGKVTMSVLPASGHRIHTRVTQGGWWGGSSSGWTPRSAAEMERDRDVGRRGEELIYLMELERVRAMGHERPESLVIWTSQTDPGADHDIKSIGEDERVRWIEVKSSTGTDGRFDWPRKEFEKALREGDRYELWRVYRAGTTNPVAKGFTNPAALLGASRIVLELGSLRAYIEDLN